MNVEEFLDSIRKDPDYAGQIVYTHRVSPREPIYADMDALLPEGIRKTLSDINIPRLYCHQAEAVGKAEEGVDVLIATGTASGKTLCYTLPVIERLRADPKARALLLFPTKALCQDQFKNFTSLLDATGLTERLAGVFDGDTPGLLRRRLRDRGSAIFSNPDMMHANIMAQHARWAEFLSNLKIVVLDELHVYSGIFGSNMALVMRRFFRLCRHYGSAPQVIASSATIANPAELGEGLCGRTFHVVDTDGSPSGGRTFVFWNPPRIRETAWRSRRSANVEAHELMAKLVEEGIPTITFSKAKMTAEMIHRYVCEKLQATSPGMVSKVTPYRGGYTPEERREIERRLFNGELLGVSTTRALELGIDVGSLEACIIVGYPGTRASFYQQSGRAGRTDEEAVVFLIGLDTSINQYVMMMPDYIFGKSVEQAVIDPDNPFVVTGHARCAAHEMPVAESETGMLGPHAKMVLKILTDNLKLNKVSDRWYHATSEIPNHEISLRNYADSNVMIQDVDTGGVIGEVNKFDAQPIIHPGAVYMHRGDTYLIVNLDLEGRIALAKREDVDYYTQPLGGTDIHHVDNRLREKEFGTGKVYWGEVTAYFNTHSFEKIHFYSLDAFAVEELDLPTLVLETMAFWLVPPENLMEKVRSARLDAHSGLRGIGYATRMILPLFMTCDTLDFSHTVGTVNSPWNAIFIYERYPHGLGFTEKAYNLMHEILPKVLENISQCTCEDGCPCCVGKPLRQYATWDVERGEASIPHKAPARMILEGYLGDGNNLVNDDLYSLSDAEPASAERLEQALRRRLERMREPEVFHPITPAPQVGTGYPAREQDKELGQPDSARRKQRHRAFDRGLHKRIAKKIAVNKLSAFGERTPLEDGNPGTERDLPRGMKKRGTNLTPEAFEGKGEGRRSEGRDQRSDARSQRAARHAGAPDSRRDVGAKAEGQREGAGKQKNVGGEALVMGDKLAARARKRYKKKRSDDNGNSS